MNSTQAFLFRTPELVVGQFAVAALSERRNSLRIQDRRSETAATKFKLTHYPGIRTPDVFWIQSGSFTVTVLTSVYCWRPYSPSSRPMPDCLKPPKGAAASKTS